jgi:protein O-mannosyl-transferase
MASPTVVASNYTDTARTTGVSRPAASVGVVLLLVVATFVAYAPAFHHGFISYDDDRYVTDNAHVRGGLRGADIRWAFTTFEQANWHPLTWISHQLDCQLFQLNPAGHHFTSTLLQAIDAALLFLILQWFTGATWRSGIVAGLFAVHPINVESVAWVAERKTLLSMLFLLLAMAAYGWYVRKPNIGRYAAVTVLFAAGLMSKPMVITLPFILLLLDYWPLGRMRVVSGESRGENWGEQAFAPQTESFAKLCVEKIPLLLLAAGSAAITMFVQRAGGAVVSSHRVSLGLRIGNAVVSYALYLKKMLWPSELAIIYPYPHALPGWQVGAAAALLVAVSLVVLRYRAGRYLVTGWLWYLGTLVPMIGLVQVGNQAMADRYAYLPLIGVFVMIVWAAGDWVKVHPVTAKYAAVIVGGVVAVLCWTTRAQLSYWESDYRLWSHALKINPRNFVAENNLGLALIRQGRRDEAIPHFREAAAIEPGDPTSQLNLGIYAQEQRDIPQAVARYAEVLRLTTDAQLRASAYANLGSIYFGAHDYTRAKENFEAVLRLDRAFPVVIRDLGLIAEKNDDWNGSIQYFARLVAVEPNGVNYFLLAQAFHQAGRDTDATWAYQQAVRLSKDINETRGAAAQLQAQ